MAAQRSAEDMIMPSFLAYLAMHYFSADYIPLCALLRRRRSLHCIEISCRKKLPLNEQIWSKKHYTEIPWSHLHCYRSSSQGEMPCALVINESRDSPSYYSWMEPQREFQAQKLLLQQAMAQQLPSTLWFKRNSFLDNRLFEGTVWNACLKYAVLNYCECMNV